MPIEKNSDPICETEVETYFPKLFQCIESIRFNEIYFDTKQRLNVEFERVHEFELYSILWLCFIQKNEQWIFKSYELIVAEVLLDVNFQAKINRAR